MGILFNIFARDMIWDRQTKRQKKCHIQTKSPVSEKGIGNTRRLFVPLEINSSSDKFLII